MRLLKILILLVLVTNVNAQIESIGANLSGITVTANGGDVYTVEGTFNDPTGVSAGTDLAVGDYLWTPPLNASDTCRQMEITAIDNAFSGYVVFEIDANGQGAPSTQNSKLMRYTNDNAYVYIPSGGNESLRECIAQYFSGQLDNTLGSGGSGGDTLGNHIQTQVLNTQGNYISPDGTNKGSQWNANSVFLWRNGSSIFQFNADLAAQYLAWTDGADGYRMWMPIGGGGFGFATPTTIFRRITETHDVFSVQDTDPAISTSVDSVSLYTKYDNEGTPRYIYGTGTHPDSLHTVATLDDLASAGSSYTWYDLGNDIWVVADGAGVTATKNSTTGEFTITIPAGVEVRSGGFRAASSDADGANDMFLILDYDVSVSFNQGITTARKPHVELANGAVTPSRGTPSFTTNTLQAAITDVASGDIEVLLDDAGTFFPNLLVTFTL